MHEYDVTRHAPGTGEVTSTETVSVSYHGAAGTYVVRSVVTGEAFGEIKRQDGYVALYVFGDPGYGNRLEYVGMADDEQAAAQALANYSDGYRGEGSRTVQIVMFGRQATWHMYEAVSTLGFEHVAQRNVWVRTSPEALEIARQYGYVALTKISV